MLKYSYNACNIDLIKFKIGKAVITNMKNQFVLILDLGGRNNQLIARRVRECNVYCEVHPYTLPLEKIKELDPVGIILIGDTVFNKVREIDNRIWSLGIPILGISSGMHIMAKAFGGSINTSENDEYSEITSSFDSSSVLFDGIANSGPVWMSEGSLVDMLPDNFTIIADADTMPIVSIEDSIKKLYGVQFHPEISNTKDGLAMLRNFLYKICGCVGDWTMESYAKASIANIRKIVGDKKVLLALSGGVDSSVAAALLSKAIGEQLTCIFVDHGFMRKNEGDEVEEAFSDWDINLVRVNAGERFLNKLSGISDPETKRKLIGEEFIRVFEDEAKKIGVVDFLVQGTIYPDVIESGAGDAALIKSHHNVGGLPDHVDFKEIIEPLRQLFKDEVRQLGLVLGLDERLVFRQPFPGPGLAIRVIGDITFEKLEILREADYIFRDEIAKASLDKEIHQYFCVLTSMRSVGVTKSQRTYDYTLALRGVVTNDFMTADYARIPYDVLDKISRRIISEAGSINRIVYDITSKPPATIEWE